MSAEERHFQPRCCPCCESNAAEPATAGPQGGFSRRHFLGGLGGAAIGGMALSGLSWSLLRAGESAAQQAPARKPLVVKPVLSYATPSPRPQTSWRSWGGIQTEADAQAELARIQDELAKLKQQADFPVEFLPVTGAKSPEQVPAAELQQCDAMLLYAAGGPMSICDLALKAGKDVVYFVRHKSGPVYLWYEIVSPRYLRQHTDQLAMKGLAEDDVVVDSLDEVLWRLRALCGLKNVRGLKILAIGGPGAWAQSAQKAAENVQRLFGWELKTITYEQLSQLIKEARADQAAVESARKQAEQYLKIPGTTLETKREFVDNCFLLERVFLALLNREQCKALTVNACMGTIMPVSDTTACLTLTLLNDAGYLAYCESDFIVIPSCALLSSISGKPAFLHNPCYPHDGVITLSHCTAPRKMDGKNLEPARILTHFESDYGAAPKVEMRPKQKLTHIIPDFAFRTWAGLRSEIIDNPFMDICRTQIDVRFSCDSLTLAQKLRGFHWGTIYGDYIREVGYALRRIGIGWEVLG